MRNIFYKTLLSLMVCNVGAIANFEKDADLVLKKYVSKNLQAEYDNKRKPTPATIVKLGKAYAKTEAASNVAKTRSVSQAMQLVNAYVIEAKGAKKVHKQNPTSAAITRLHKTQGAAKAANKVLLAILQAERLRRPQTQIIYVREPLRFN